MTYEYACTACAHEWEFEQSIRDEAITECPQCHGQTARRQISRGTGFILKGGGWYSDLYSAPSNKKEAATKPADGKAADTKASDSSADKGGGDKGGGDKGGGGGDKPTTSTSAAA